jgi:DNA-binding NarL/FixJ family response regulator
VLGLTEGTVKIHVSAIIKALKVTNRAEAALIASRKQKKIA